MTDSPIIQQQLAEIRDEWKRRTAEPADAVFDCLEAGDIVDASSRVLFSAEPADRGAIVESLQHRLPDLFAAASPEQKTQLLQFAVKLALDFGSFLPSWRSGDPSPQTAHAAALRSLAEKLATADRDTADSVRSDLRAELLARLGAEAVSDAAEAQRVADAAMGDDLSAHIGTMWNEYRASNTRRAAELYLRGGCVTALGNDYAAFLDHALRVGVCSQTTNPVLIKLAWDTDPPAWNQRIDKIITDTYEIETIRRTLGQGALQQDELIRHLNTLVTTTVVERNCRMLRDIFLLTEGREGHLNLQVSPENYADSEAMVEQAVAVYEDLRQRLGGVPNVVIKIPATPAGREAVAELTRRGIGVTVTLTFSMYQAGPIAEAIRDGNALAANIAVMNGRLAFPVRDELAEAGVAGGVEAARWAGVEVARKVNSMLYNPTDRGGMGLDRNRIRLLIASLRIYEDWLPDISELWGVPAITIFPNVRRTFDSHPREIDPNAIGGATPPDAIDTMLSSEIFRQAWWTENDGSHGKPDRPLSMQRADDDAVANWAPVKQTLDQFIDGYRTMNGMILGRLKSIVEQ